MQLRFNSAFLSITPFQTVELPQFVALTGVNGSGKSHLLRAIEQKSVVIEGLDDPHVVLFNYENFRLENEAKFTSQAVAQERLGAWNFFSEDARVQFKGQLQAFENQLGDSRDKILVASEATSKPIWHLSRSDLSDTRDYDALRQYKKKLSNFVFGNQHVKGRQETKSIFAMLKKSQRFLSDINQPEFLDLYEPYTLKEDFLPTQLGKIFSSYFWKFDDNRFRNYENEKYGEQHDALTDEEFFARYGPKPWDVVNEILARLGSMPYRINSPESERVGREHQFKASLWHEQRPDVRPEFNELSSGERILMALVASVYKSQADRHFPDVLLLDEIDASLHPSMIQNLLDVIEEVFLANGVRVLLVTHSPTTIALCPEDAVFLMNREGERRIEKKTRAEALEVLTEGFATLEQGLKVFDHAARATVSLLTEGRNVSLIQAALCHAQISGVEVITGIESFSGKRQLRTIYDFFCEVPHENDVVIVWDCDAAEMRGLASQNRTHPFVFVLNPKNTLAPKGIENLFDEELLSPFELVIRRSNGTEERKFDGNEKVKFEEYIIKRNNPDDFRSFRPLIDFLCTIKCGASG